MGTERIVPVDKHGHLRAHVIAGIGDGDFAKIDVFESADKPDDRGDTYWAIWSPEGKQIVFNSSRCMILKNCDFELKIECGRRFIAGASYGGL